MSDMVIFFRFTGFKVHWSFVVEGSVHRVGVR